MSPNEPRLAALEREPDWDDLCALIRRRIRTQLGAAEPALLDDLTQEAAIRLLRATRRSRPDSIEALALVIAKATAIDEIRRRRREERRLGDWITGQPSAASGPDTSPGPSPEFLWFVLVELLRQHVARCHPLALLYSEKGDWKRVAEEVGQSYVAVRKQWSRCMRVIRDALMRNPHAAAAWSDHV